jgi:thiol-disulfide isomerase/thioredoxin
MKFRAVAALALSAAAATLVAAACVSQKAEASCSSAKDCLPAIGFEDLHKQRFDRDALRDRVVVVNFWATWCGPCKKEIPAFNRVYTKYKDRGVVMLGMLQDNQVDDMGLLNFMSDHELTYPVVKVNPDILAAFEHPNALPTTFIYDKRGKVHLVHRGPLEEDQLAAHLDTLLAR